MVAVIAWSGVFLSACGGDAESPEDFPLLEGTWEFDVTDLTIPSVECEFTRSVLRIQQNGGRLSGNYIGGVVACTHLDVNETDTVAVGSGTIANGRVETDGSVGFDLDTPGFHHTGRVRGDSVMSGQATWQFNVGRDLGVRTLQGRWEAELTAR